MKNWILKNKLILLGAVLGGIVGYGYYALIGCENGTCMISSKPVNSTAYFGVMGALFFSIFKKKDDGNRKQA